jgi:hypothetical protein
MPVGFRPAEPAILNCKGFNMRLYPDGTFTNADSSVSTVGYVYGLIPLPEIEPITMTFVAQPSAVNTYFGIALQYGDDIYAIKVGGQTADLPPYPNAKTFTWTNNANILAKLWKPAGQKTKILAYFYNTSPAKVITITGMINLTFTTDYSSAWQTLNNSPEITLTENKTLTLTITAQ